MSSPEIRNRGRVECHAPAQLTWTDAATGAPAYLVATAVDVSNSGVQLEIPVKIAERTLVTFRIEQLGLHGTGSVRYCKRLSRGWSIGLEFAGGLEWKGAPAETRKARRYT